MNTQRVTIQTEFIRLDALLKLAGAAETGGHAKVMIQGGEIALNGTTCTERGKKIRPGDRITLRDGSQAIEVAADEG